MSKAISSFTSQVKKVGNAVKNAADQAKNVAEQAMYIVETEAKARKELLDPSRDYGVLWEKNENVEFCRGCNLRFDNLVTNRKHHCRSCAGVFCDNCSPHVEKTAFNLSLLPATADTTNNDTIRLCLGCKFGECPSQGFKKLICSQLQDAANGIQPNLSDLTLTAFFDCIFSILCLLQHWKRQMRTITKMYYLTRALIKS